MKNLLRGFLALLALAAMTAALVLLFGTMDRSRGQPAALAPTPTPKPAPPLILTNVIVTPTLSPTPRPLPPVIVDPVWPAPKPAPRSTEPTPTPIPPTGGPYISQSEAISIAARAAGPGVDKNVPPKAYFLPAKDIPTVIPWNKSAPQSELEVWVVALEGRFSPSRVPRGEPAPTYRKTYLVIDATSGKVSSTFMQEPLP